MAPHPRKENARRTIPTLTAKPPLPPLPRSAVKKPQPFVPNLRLERPRANTPSAQPYSTGSSRPPSLRDMNNSALNTSGVRLGYGPAAAAAALAAALAAAESEKGHSKMTARNTADARPKPKWEGEEVEEVDLSMEDIPFFPPSMADNLQSFRPIAPLPSTVNVKPKASPSPPRSHTASFDDKPSPATSMKRKSPSFTQTAQPPPKRTPPGSFLDSPNSKASSSFSSSHKPSPSPPKKTTSRAKKDLMERFGLSSSESDTDHDSDKDANEMGNLAAPRAFPAGQDTSLDSHYRNHPLPDGAQAESSLADFIDSIPLEDRAPVGRRRLIRKKDFDDDGSDEEVDDDDGEISLEQQIESDKKKIEAAAGRLGCRRMWMTNTRKEEIVGADGRGEAVASVKTVESDTDVKDKGKGKATAQNGERKGLLDAFMDASDDDEDMVLRRPGEAPLKKDKGKQKVVNQRQNKAPETGVNDDMEWIDGAELGQRDVNRQFKDVVEEQQMWRVSRMISPLLEHQVLGADWMVAREMSEKLPRGGLVADAMGLGKTIQSIATMIVNPPPPPLTVDDPVVTLIVAPVALLQQWKAEIEQHAKRGSFNVHIHHGADKINTLKRLRKQDVVITSYATIMHSYPCPKKPKGMSHDEQEVWWEEQWENNRGIFHRLKFWRVILDEAHVIKNRYSRTSLACQELSAMHTWALTGTPIQNSLNDLFPIFRFIRHPHLGRLDKFQAITKGMERNYQPAARRVQVVLRGCMMRRNKKDMLLGKELIVLPKKRVRMVELEFNEEERALYECVEEMSRDVMNKYIQAGTVMKNYSQVLVMLMRLRQICDHPYLILQTINENFTVSDLDRALPSEGAFAKPSGLRKILTAARLIAVGDTDECSICLDNPEGPVITKCRHVFCRDCITNVITQNAREGMPGPCPLCKSEIRIDDLTAYSPTDPDKDPDADLYLNAIKSKKQEADEWLDSVGDFMHSAKTIALRDQLLEWRENHPGDKIVLFSQFTKMLDIVEKVLDEEGWGLVRYQGTMNLGDREDALRTFRNDPGCWVMLTSLRAGGVGLNLTHANLVLSLDLWWNAAVELQAFDRVHRMGQKKEVFVSRLIVKNTVEQRIMGLQQKKQNIANAALGDGVGTQVGKLTQRELVGLFGNIVDGPDGMMRLVGNEEMGERGG